METDPKAVKRLTAALLYADGSSPYEIKRLLGFPAQTVYNWLDTVAFAKQNSGLSSFTGGAHPLPPVVPGAHADEPHRARCPEKFPDLDWVFLEAGIGWVPYLLWRLDKHHLSRRSELSRLERKPSEYADDQFYYAS